MSGFTFDISGEIGKNLDNVTVEVVNVLNNELSAFGIETVAMAKTLCAVDEGFLRNSITFDKLDLAVLFSVNAFYAAYVEFGTGIFAAAYLPSLPEAIQQYAQTFFVNGKGRVTARPFLFPAIEANKLILLQNLKNQLNSN